MRAAVALAIALACSTVGCGAGAALNQSNSAKMGEALAFAAVAGAAQIVQSAAEQHARQNAPVNRSSTGARLSPGCDNDDQYGCVSVSGSPGTASAQAPAETEMSEDDARDYVLGYVNGVRKLNGVGPLVREDNLDAFAQAGSEELAQDHKQNRHWTEHARELSSASGEIQGSPDGARPGPLQDRIAEILLGMMGEGAGGMHHDAMLKPEWRTMGVGIANRSGRLYFTVDFSSD